MSSKKKRNFQNNNFDYLYQYKNSYCERLYDVCQINDIKFPQFIRQQVVINSGLPVKFQWFKKSPSETRRVRPEFISHFSTFQPFSLDIWNVSKYEAIRGNFRHFLSLDKRRVDRVNSAGQIQRNQLRFGASFELPNFTHKTLSPRQINLDFAKKQNQFQK